MNTQGRTHSVWLWFGAAIIAVVLLLAFGALGSWLWSETHQPNIVEPPPAPFAMLMRPIPNGPGASLLRRGRYLVIAGDCASCHTRAGGRPFNGGRGLRTPFGTIYTPDISGDTATGIGKWTQPQFFRALNDGVAANGTHLYPAFPFPHFTIISREDSDAILAYLKTVPGVADTPPANRLPFPINLRISAAAWQVLFFRSHGFHPDKSKSAAWNRGAYLVEGPEHCGACHTPKNLFGAENKSRLLQGATLDNWVAPDLTGNPRMGLGRWSPAEIVEFLKTGRNVHSDAAGTMAEVVSYSTSQLSDGDLKAIAAYLKDIPASTTKEPDAPDTKALKTGAAVYFDSCTACHYVRGQGSPRFFPPLAGSAITQQSDPTGVIRLTLAGGRAGPTPTRPSPVSMPAFAWKLTDQQVADVVTYIRNSWGNRASSVSAHDVAKLRESLSLVRALDQHDRSVSN
ncbi:MAG TPA: cytochrome c [Rhizomicrobium sp.]|nr:cytochrome c [Rhizomicrobium sp.]